MPPQPMFLDYDEYVFFFWGGVGGWGAGFVCEFYGSKTACDVGTATISFVPYHRRLRPLEGLNKIKLEESYVMRTIHAEIVLLDQWHHALVEEFRIYDFGCEGCEPLGFV